MLAAKQLGAERIIAMSRHEPRQKLALEFGATDIVTERGDDGVARIKDLTGGLGAHSVIEAVGTQESMMQAIRATRPGGHVGYVGVTHDVPLPGMELFFSHVHLHGGPAPVRRFLPDLIDRIWTRQIDPGKVFDLELPLDEAADGYRAMDRRSHQGPAPSLTSPADTQPLRCERTPQTMNPDLRLHRPGRLRHRRQLRHGPGHRPRLRRRPAPQSPSPTSTQAALAVRRRRPSPPPDTGSSTCPATSPTRPASPPPSTPTVEQFGRLDMAFNNAGIQVPPSDAADEPAEVFDRVNAVNLRGVWACMKHELAQMRGQGSGAIVNCSSLGGLVGLPGRAAYHASKHGVLGLTSSAALEYAPRGVRINAVCPGPSPPRWSPSMIEQGELDPAAAVANQPINRLGEPEEIAAAVLWLCSPGASFVIGVALPVDGGYTAQ